MGKPGGGNAPSPVDESIVYEEGTRRTETSKKPEGKKEKSIPPVAASEAGRGQTSRLRTAGVADHQGEVEGETKTEGKRFQRGLQARSRSQRRTGGTRVPRDTRNPVGSRGDHPPSLKTISDR